MPPGALRQHLERMQVELDRVAEKIARLEALSEPSPKLPELRGSLKRLEALIAEGNRIVAQGGRPPRRDSRRP